jgi:hypothetical protein
MRAPRLASRSFAAVISWVPAVFLAVNGCIVHLPPPQVPEKTVPQVANPAESPSQGEGQIVIDTTNGPANVQVSLLQVGNATFTHPLCATTPCAANLPYGTYNLIFQGKNDDGLGSQDTIQIGRNPSVFRHTMGSTRMSYGLYFGGMLAVVLGVVWASVALVQLGDSYSDKNATYRDLGIGGALTVGGAVMMYVGRPQITPSSSVQWAPEGGGGGPSAPTPTGDKRQVLRVTPNGVAVSFN